MFEEGTEVQIYVPTHKEGLSPKLAHNWYGPYIVHKIVSPVNLQLLHPQTGDTQIVHIARVKRYHRDNTPEFPLEEEPEINLKVDEFTDIVEAFLDHRRKGGRKLYLVKWKLLTEPTWEEEVK